MGKKNKKGKKNNQPQTYRQTLKKDIGKGFRKGAKKRVTGWIEGGGNTGGVGGGSEGGGGTSFGGVVLIVIAVMVFLLIFLIIPSYRAGTLQVGASYIAPVFESVGVVMGKLFSPIADAFSYATTGEETLSVGTSDQDIRERTGLSFGGNSIFGGNDLTVFGKDVGNEFGLNGDVVVGKLDLPMLKNVELSCEIKDVVKGRIDMDNVNSIKEGVAVFDVHNPEPYDEARIPFFCIFDPQKILEGGDLSLANRFAGTQKVFTEKIRLLLKYPLEVTSRLEVIGLPAEQFAVYRGKYDKAFELEGGIFKHLNSNIRSKAKFISDVDVALWFDKQPIGVGKEHTLRIGFRNKDTKNEFNLRKFKLEFPTGIEINSDKCGVFSIQEKALVLKEAHFKIINSILSDEKGGVGETFVNCGVKINEGFLGGSEAQIVKGGDIKSTLEYDYSLSVERQINLRRQSEASNVIVA
jgi:hypothetical protein